MAPRRYTPLPWKELKCGSDFEDLVPGAGVTQTSQSEISESSKSLPSALSPGGSRIRDFWQFSNKSVPGEAGVEAVAFHGKRMRNLSAGGSLI